MNSFEDYKKKKIEIKREPFHANCRYSMKIESMLLKEDLVDDDSDSDSDFDEWFLWFLNAFLINLRNYFVEDHQELHQELMIGIIIYQYLCKNLK